MNFTYFHEMVLQQMFGHCNRPNWSKYATTEKQVWTEVSWRNNVCTAKFSIKTRLDYDFPIEYMHFQ